MDGPFEDKLYGCGMFSGQYLLVRFQVMCWLVYLPLLKTGNNQTPQEQLPTMACWT